MCPPATVMRHRWIQHQAGHYRISSLSIHHDTKLNLRRKSKLNFDIGCGMVYQNEKIAFIAQHGVKPVHY